MDNTPGVSLFPFTMEAYEEVLQLWRVCEGIGLSDADSRENVARYLERNPGLSYIAAADRKVVGAILGGHDGRRGLLHHLAVHPSHRRRGIGRILAQRSLDALQNAGIGKCHGMVFKNNTEALAFWQSLGWVVREDVCLISKSLGQAQAE